MKLIQRLALVLPLLPDVLLQIICLYLYFPPVIVVEDRKAGIIVGNILEVIFF